MNLNSNYITCIHIYKVAIHTDTKDWLQKWGKYYKSYEMLFEIRQNVNIIYQTVSHAITI